MIVTSDKCYENREWHWAYRENEALGGHDPYSNSKGCAELVTAAYRSSFFHDTSDAALASVRAGNVIGGGDWAEDRIVPDVIKALQSGTVANVRNPLAVRPWQFVLEPLHGYMLLAEQLWLDKGKYAGAWNFGPADEAATSVGTLVGELARAWGEEVTWQRDTGAQPHEATWLKLDSSKARQVLGWNPIQALSTTLHWTVEWYQQYAELGNAREKTLEQIKLYQEALPV
jgi:CDP-glucose 4,6-dehydratase